MSYNKHLLRKLNTTFIFKTKQLIDDHLLNVICSPFWIEVDKFMLPSANDKREQTLTMIIIKWQLKQISRYDDPRVNCQLLLWSFVSRLLACKQFTSFDALRAIRSVILNEIFIYFLRKFNLNGVSLYHFWLEKFGIVIIVHIVIEKSFS